MSNYLGNSFLQTEQPPKSEFPSHSSQRTLLSRQQQKMLQSVKTDVKSVQSVKIIKSVQSVKSVESVKSVKSIESVW